MRWFYVWFGWPTWLPLAMAWTLPSGSTSTRHRFRIIMEIDMDGKRRNHLTPWNSPWLKERACSYNDHIVLYWPALHQALMFKMCCLRYYFLKFRAGKKMESSVYIGNTTWERGNNYGYQWLDGYENFETVFTKTSNSNGICRSKQSGAGDGLPSKPLCLENSCFIKAMEMESVIDSQQTHRTSATAWRFHFCWSEKKSSCC